MTAVLFGSIGTLADTSELQREAFNAAFLEHGLSWRWSREQYVALLDVSGGADRIQRQADELGVVVDAAAVHAAKSRIFQTTLRERPMLARPGVVDTLHDARRDGMRLALVTTTSPANVDAVLTALAGELSVADFDLVVDSSHVPRPKPDAAAYAYALDRLGLAAEDCVAVEDNVDGVRAARSAGVRCVAFPTPNTAGHDFGSADEVLSTVDLDRLTTHLSH